MAAAGLGAARLSGEVPERGLVGMEEGHFHSGLRQHLSRKAQLRSCEAPLAMVT